MSRFLHIWSTFHSHHQPVGYRLRSGGAANWVRFHSLPNAKRYADNADERHVILQRHNMLAAEVLRSEPCWLVQTHWVADENAVSATGMHDPFAAARQFNLQFVREFIDEDEVRWRVHAGPTQWADGAFDHLLLDIAEERAAPTLWMSETSGAIFAPYDGGVDLFLSEPEQVVFLKAKHRDWLPDRRDGL